MSKYQPGQIWKYHTRPGEEASRIFVCQVDADPSCGNIIHVQVRNLHFKPSFAPEQTLTELLLPLSENAMDESVTELEAEGAAWPDIHEGYEIWRESFEKGIARVFTFPLHILLPMGEMVRGPVEVVDLEAVVFCGGGGGEAEDDDAPDAAEPDDS